MAGLSNDKHTFHFEIAIYQVFVKWLDSEFMTHNITGLVLMI